MATTDADRGGWRMGNLGTDCTTLDNIAKIQQTSSESQQQLVALYNRNKSDLITFAFDILSSTKCPHNPDNDLSPTNH